MSSSSPLRFFSFSCMTALVSPKRMKCLAQIRYSVATITTQVPADLRDRGHTREATARQRATALDQPVVSTIALARALAAGITTLPRSCACCRQCGRTAIASTTSEAICCRQLQLQPHSTRRDGPTRACIVHAAGAGPPAPQPPHDLETAAARSSAQQRAAAGGRPIRAGSKSTAGSSVGL
jgi:hypothetical protein